MKTKILCALLLSVGLVSCEEEKKPKVVEAPPPVIPTVTAPELHGSWVKAVYMEDLNKTYSPLKSFGKLSDIAVFSFDTANLKGDTLVGSVSFNGHEGSGCIAYFKSGKTPRSILITVEGDTVKTPRELVLANNELLLMSYPSNGSAIAEKYVRMNETTPNIDSALSYAARQVLFAGKWQVKEAAKGGKTYPIEMLENGTIKGSESYIKYDVMTDYAAEPMPYDELFLFDAKMKKPRILQFKINSDTVKLTERIRKKDVAVYQFLKLK